MLLKFCREDKTMQGTSDLWAKFDCKPGGFLIFHYIGGNKFSVNVISKGSTEIPAGL